MFLVLPYDEIKLTSETKILQSAVAVNVLTWVRIMQYCKHLFSSKYFSFLLCIINGPVLHQ